MSKKLYVGNLGCSISNSDLEQMFSQHGAVDNVQVIVDRSTGRCKGFGFVEMSSDAEADTAIAALNGQDRDGRALTVNEAKPRATHSGGGYGRGR